MQIGYHTITWGGVVGEPTDVTSLKDLYYRANGSMRLYTVDRPATALRRPRPHFWRLAAIESADAPIDAAVSAP